MRNVLITGTPRSGTTLLCSLLNKLPDVVALNEPMNVWEFPKLPHADAVVEAVEAFCVDSRRSLHEHRFAISGNVAGEIPDNIASDRVNRTGSRPRQTERGKVHIEKPLSPNFTLAVKHPVAFTALLGALTKRFDCFAIVRNPLATLASWNSLEWINVKDGHVPIGEQLDTRLQGDLASMSDPYDRQLHILEWFYERLREFLPVGAIVKYEDVIASGGQQLANFFPAAANLHEDLSSKNLNRFYDRDLMMQLGERLLKRDGSLWHFYSKDDVEDLLKRVGSTTQ